METNKKTEHDLSIEKLHKTGQISRLTLLVCRAAGITFLSEILEYYFEYGHFNYIKTCGPKTSRELKRIFEKYKWYDLIDNPDRLKNDFNIELINLTADQMSKLQDYVDSSIASLNERARSALIKSVGWVYGHKDILSMILDKQIDFRKIRNVGSKSVKELEDLRIKCIRFINGMKSFQEK